MVRLLTNAALAQGRPIPESKTLGLTAAVWSETLAAIPDNWLDRAFAGAIQRKRDGFPLAAGEVLAAWEELLLDRQKVAQQTDPARLLPAGPAQTCDTCKGKHWVRVRKGEIGQCPDCEGQSEIEGARAREGPSYLVQNLLPVLWEFCQEHNDPLPLPTRLEYASECARQGIYAETIRPLLESAGKPTLYETLIFLGVPVKPPVAPTPLRAEGPQPATALF